MLDCKCFNLCSKLRELIMHNLHSDINIRVYNIRNTGRYSWLRHWAASRKVAGSLSDDVIGISH